ncbi:MAG: thioredoxin family protein [Pirellulaceae bacterium]
MSKFIKFLMLSWCAMGFCPTAEAADGVEWLRSAEQAAELSKKTGKPIMIYVRSENCHYCDRMQQEVWQNPMTAAIVMREFVPLKLTREENKEAVEAMKVKGYPSTLIFSAARTYVGRLDGYLSNEKFLAAISEVRTAAAEQKLQR